jgi:integrase
MDSHLFKTKSIEQLITDVERGERALRRSRRDTSIPWVFWRMVAKGRGGELKPKAIRSITKAWRNACRAAACPGRIPHDLRRTAVRNLVRSGIPERVAMQMTGHKTRSVFERYNIVSEGDLRDAARRLDRLPGARAALL